MFTTCIYCTSGLQQNEVLEAFPVGRRIAFDAANGRLWVVCRACQRWNLSPLDERWEAIDQAERLFRDSRLRVSSDNIGMARLREGLELIRIGAPQRPEMAAWRYGDQFGRRRKRQLIMTGAIVGTASAVVLGGLVAGAGIATFASWAANGGMWDALVNGRPGALVGRILTEDGRQLIVNRSHARMSAIIKSEDDGPLILKLEHTTGNERLYGAEAMRAASQLLPAVNRFGGSRKDVDEAVTYLESTGGPAEALKAIQDKNGRFERESKNYKTRSKPIVVTNLAGALHTMPVRERLVLEMALHEEQEHRAMMGELAELERAWREADEIAHIADNMFDTPQLESELARMKSAAAATPRTATESEIRKPEF